MECMYTRSLQNSAEPFLRPPSTQVLHSDLPSVFHVGANPRAFRAMRGEPKCLIASKVPRDGPQIAF